MRSQALNARQQISPQRQDLESLVAVEDWLQAVFNSPAGERVRASKVQELIRNACNVYATEVEQKTRFALSETQLSLPAPNLGAFSACGDISIAEDAATGITGVIGGSTALAASR